MAPNLEKYRTRNTEPVHTIIRRLGMNVKEFGQVYGFNRGRMVHQGNGRFTTISDSIFEALEDLAKQQGTTLEKAILDEYALGSTDGRKRLQEIYEDWQTQKRAEANLPTRLPRRIAGEAPIAQLTRAVGGISTLSRKLCVNEYVLRRFVKGEAKRIPDQFITALEESNWPLAGDFLDAQERWFVKQAKESR